MSKPLVGIIMGSDSDLPVMSEAVKMCEEFGIEFEVSIVSAHRTPDRLVEYSKSAVERGLKVIIAGAGGAAHLPGMVAALTPLPVIGVPVRGSNLEGMDSLLKNAGILASQIIGSNNSEIREKISIYKEQMNNEVMSKVEKLDSLKYKEYLAQMPKKK